MSLQLINAPGVPVFSVTNFFFFFFLPVLEPMLLFIKIPRGKSHGENSETKILRCKNSSN